MKNIYLLIVLFLISIDTIAQNEIGYGVSFGGATSKSFFFDMLFRQKTSRYHIGMSFQRNGQRGPAKSERLSNYGTTSIGSGNYFVIFDMKYSRIIKKKYTALAEVSIGSKKQYTNYKDNRFNGGGYHLIRGSTPIAGVGIAGGYDIGSGFEITLGYNTLRGVAIGLIVGF